MGGMETSLQDRPTPGVCLLPIFISHGAFMLRAPVKQFTLDPNSMASDTDPLICLICAVKYLN